MDLYTYKAVVTRVVDGDTVRLRVDVGFHMTTESNFRLKDINAPELRGEERPAGLASKSFLQSLLPVGTELYIKTNKDTGKYGRWIATLYMREQKGGPLLNVNQALIDAGHAVHRVY